jgi:hypothetical protein
VLRDGKIFLERRLTRASMTRLGGAARIASEQIGFPVSAKAIDLDALRLQATAKPRQVPLL